MSSKAFRADRCTICHKFRDHSNHSVGAAPPLWSKLLHLYWPKWTWGAGADKHIYVSGQHVELGNQLARLKHDMRRKARRRAGA